MPLRCVLLAASCLALPLSLAPVAARAQPIEGVYIGAGAGYNYLAKLTANARGAGIPPGQILSAGLKGDGGFLGSLAAGYGLGNGFRLEVQGDYREDNQNLHGSVFSGGDSSTASYGGYFNALFDFDIGSPVFFPYAGAGVGYREITLNRFRAYLPGETNGYASDGSWKGSFSAQAMLGVGVAVYGVPGLTLTSELRWTGTFAHDTFAATQDVTGGIAGPVGIRVGHQNNYSFLLGARYAFDVPPPPLPTPAAAPAPAVAPARTYLVFFDWDRADLTARARQIIGEAAANVAKVPVTMIEVNGYTDLTGSAAYNQTLSVRRADAVTAELVRDGVPRSEIAVKGFGESNPLVQTALGVREPQNRRVEIVLK